jgi:hypothetical protein
MHNVTERVYIFSVYNSTRDEALNYDVHKKHLQLLKDKRYSVTEIEGRYNGKDERSILVYGTNQTEKMIEEFSRAQLQESYLVVYHDGFSELVFSTGIRKGIGTMKLTTESDAKSRTAYSKVGNQWFIIE